MKTHRREEEKTKVEGEFPISKMRKIGYIQ